jgi:hypothetical protein
MTSLGSTAYQVFNDTLARWRREGRRIGWPELQEAYEIARAAEEQEERQGPATGHKAGGKGP